MSEDYKKYDTADKYEMAGARLAKDAEVRETANGKMVRLTIVSTSRVEGDSDLWVEVNVADRQADFAAYLKKGDILHKVEGKPCLRRYGDDNEKFSFSIRHASFVSPIALFTEVKSRGFTPGAAGNSGSGAPNKKGGKLPPKKSAKPVPPPKSKRPVMDLDDDADDDAGDDE